MTEHRSSVLDCWAEVTAYAKSVTRAADQVNTDTVSVPRILDEEFAKALMVQHTLSEEDANYAHEAWELIVAEADKRAAQEGKK